QELDRIAEPLAETPQERMQQLHRMIVQLLTPEAYEGNLAVQCATPGADVYLDDRLLGTTPLPPQEHLRAGVHVLRLSKVGYSDIQRFVEVIYNRAATVQVDLADTTVAGQIVEERSSTGFGAVFIVTDQPGYDLRVDGEPLGVTPFNSAIAKIAAGRRRISLRKPGGQPVVMEVEVAEGRRTDLVLTVSADNAPILRAVGRGPVLASQPLPTLTAALSGDTPEGIASSMPLGTEAEVDPAFVFPTWRYYAGMGMGLAGIAALAVGGFYGRQVSLLNHERETKVDEASQAAVGGTPSYTTYADQVADINARGTAAELRQKIAYGAGGTLVAAGAGLLLWDLLRSVSAPMTVGAAPPRAEAPPVSLLPVLTPTTTGLVLDVGF
ncbi:MAG TPA: PEGA domain-containing protein, partial [Myxococcota bacterium]|nr:PEGA domain-containing protein [Myxococcota bacterium]